MAYGQVMACLLKLTPTNMFIDLGKSCGKNSCSYLLFYVKGTFVFTSYTLSPLIRFQNLGFGIWNSALNNSWIPVTITEIWNPSFTDRQVICAIQNPRLSWTTLHGLSLRFHGWDLILSPCSVLPRYLRLRGLPGLIHWKIVATWLKNHDLKWYQIFRNLLIPNTENKKKTLIMRKQLPFTGLRKNRRITVTYRPSEEQTLNSQLQVFMKSYSGYSIILHLGS